MISSKKKLNSLHVNTLPDQDLSIPASSTRSLRSPFKVPIQYERFARSFETKDNEGLFLGREPEVSQTNRRQYAQICRVAKTEFLKGSEILEPTPQALERTKLAAKAFFSLSYPLLNKLNMKFPLAGRNKCLGMVAVPTTNLVIIAISQDKSPANDVLLRKEMVIFLNQLNQTTNEWKFELACIPTKAQYLMPRTISMRTPHAASESSVKPHTRCVEVALMAALCKAGRTRSFTSADTGIIAFGGTLWAHSEGAEAIPHFAVNELARNLKYTKQHPLEVVISPTLSGWLDIWEPCPEHCKIYKYEMLAIGAAGGFSSSFFEPRSEGELPKRNLKDERNGLINQRLSFTIALGVISTAVCGAGLYVRTQHQNGCKDHVSMAMLSTAILTSSITIVSSFHLLLATYGDRDAHKKNDLGVDIIEMEARPRADSCPI